jgi:DNA-binding FadR family transcriptional regulator
VFHQAVAHASKNDVLSAAYDFIWQNGKFSPVMEYIRISVGGKMAVDHSRILEAIIAKDAVLAEQLMVMHIDGLIDDANKYWGHVPRAQA